MENYNMIIAGVIGSSATLLLTALFDYLKEKYRSKIEIHKLVFQRKTNAVENAISWLQESIDCYRMMQFGCNDIDEKYNPVVWERIVRSSNQANKLYAEAGKYLNPIYLYYDFKEIEDKYNALKSAEYINYAITKIGKLNQIAIELQNVDGADISEDLQRIRENEVLLFKELYKAIDDQIMSMSEIICTLRKEYSKYSD